MHGYRQENSTFPVRLQKCAPRLNFAGACLGQEAGTMRSQETFFGLKRVREVKALQGYNNPGKKSFSQPTNIVKGVQIE